MWWQSMNTQQYFDDYYNSLDIRPTRHILAFFEAVPG
jgi:hypothetical protein